MKKTVTAILICLLTISGSSTAAVSDAISKGDPATIKIGGYLGSRIDACELHRVKEQDVHHFTAPFYDKTETHRWQSEFWGKWTLGAVLAYRYNHDAELLNSIKSGVESILGSQLPNGYIGNYSEAAQLQEWDIWGRKYTLLGLLSYYDLTGDRKVLDACRRVADHLLTQAGTGKVAIVTTGNYRGMPSSSILEPMVYLYNYTGDNRYLDFAKYIVAQWETPQGPQLISKAAAGIPVADRFPHPGLEGKSWTTSGAKAYEMMSCYEGLLELYKITGNAAYLSAVEKVVRNIIDEEINIAGSGSAHECWYHGKAHQTQPTYHTMETCVTMTWMKLCQTLLSLTGNPLYADQIEKSAYNALLASLKDDATQTAMYSPLVGQHFFTDGQCGMHINCCSANAPRAFALLPQFAVMQSNKDIFINLYSDLTAELALDKKQKVRITQTTVYPENGNVKIQIDTEKPAAFSVNLRIPASPAPHLSPATISINGEKLGNIASGTYYQINRTWKKGDIIQLELDVRARVVKDDKHVAIVKGPIVLARDNRFNDGLVDMEAAIVDKDGFVELTPVVQKPTGMWMAFTAPMKLGTFPSGETQVHFCDFGSAGNAWTSDSRHRVWIPEILDNTKSNQIK